MRTRTIATHDEGWVRTSVGRRVGLAMVASAVALFGAVVAAPPAGAATILHVCASTCAYTSLADAVAAAHNGDTITLAPGTYAGGMTIDVSVNLRGAGAGSTVISGGGDHSVLTIGVLGDSWEPTVSIEGVTITGGTVRTSPESRAFIGEDGVAAAGGGIEIPPNQDFSGGAIVTIRDSVITGNRVAPSHTFAPPPDQADGWPACPSGPCPFGLAVGGGIDSWGTVTLQRSTVSNNLVGSASGLSDLASDANGGAIDSVLAALTVTQSTISGNAATAAGPIARFADAGGVFAEGGSLTIANDSITNNSAVLHAQLPKSVDLLAVAGAVHVGGGVNSASVRDTTISDNLLEMTNSVGNANGFSGGLHNDGGIDMTISDVTEANNRVRVSTLGASTGNAAADSGAGEGQGLMTNVRLTGNSVVAYSVHGNAHASAGAGVFAGTVTSSTITGNDSRASAPHGFADASGGALSVAGALTVRATVLDGNTTHASGNKGSALGGAIFATRFPGGPPAGPIMLINSQVTHNVASTTGLTAHGGGIYTTPDYPVTLTNSVLANNQPDQCFGC